jgi:2-phosphoglycerate kinase
MIYLIGGPPRCGKTTLSKLLTKNLGLPWISADTIESIVENTFLHFAGGIDSEEYARVFPKNTLRIKTSDSNDILFRQYSAKAVAEAFINQGQSIFEALKTMIAAESSAGHDYIIEGHQIQPSLVHELLKENIELKSIFLIRHDIDQMSIGFQKNQAKRDWVLQKTKQKGTYSKIAAMIAQYSVYVQKEADKCNLPVFDMDGDFLSKIEEASALLQAES